MIVILIILLIIAIIYIWFAFFRLPVGTAVMVNGGVKTGKTLLVVEQAIHAYKMSMFKYYIKRIFKRKSKKPKEKPRLYSNIPIKCKGYIPLTTDMILRKERFAYGSTIVISEISLVANSMNYKDDLINEELELFIKLIGHETRGGKLFIDTQALADNHFAVKRSIDSTLWIERTINLFFLPFVIQRIRRLVVCNENTTNTVSDDTESLYTHIIFKSVFKKYNRYIYSIFTDDLSFCSASLNLESVSNLESFPTMRTFKTLNHKKLCTNRLKRSIFKRYKK